MWGTSIFGQTFTIELFPWSEPFEGHLQHSLCTMQHIHAVSVRNHLALFDFVKENIDSVTALIIICLTKSEGLRII